MLRRFFLIAALWNTLVATFNIIVLPRFYSPEVLVFTMTPSNLFLPVLIPLAIWVFFPKVCNIRFKFDTVFSRELFERK